VDAAIKQGWSYILLVYSDDEVGIQGAAVIEEYGKERGICSNPADPQSYYGVVAENIAKHHANVSIYFGDLETGTFLDYSFLFSKFRKLAVAYRFIGIVS